MDSPKTEKRSFAFHPAIIKTLINEQSGSMAKAMAELVMNAVDAGASKIELTIQETGEFTLRDNGKGFNSREEIEKFFETFGTPHEANDAYYGKFRIGRGQIMSFAKTVWRSGHFEMRVDLEEQEEFVGYALTEHAESRAGCEISGTFYKFSESTLAREFIGWGGKGNGDFCDLIRYVPIPVLVNGSQVNTLPSEEKWDTEDDYAWYKFDRQTWHLTIYNRGIFVCWLDAHKFGIGGIISSKTPLMVNLARNSLIEYKCPTWTAISDAIRARFSLQLSRSKKLTDNEAVALLKDLLFSDLVIDDDLQEHIQSLRFIPDIFGELKSPKDMIFGRQFTLFDGQNMAIAERVQRECLATVIMPSFLRRAGMRVDPENAKEMILQLRNRLGWSENTPCVFIPFDHLVKEFSDTSNLVEDDELDPEELLVLNALREINDDLAWITNGGNRVPRRLIAGTADRMHGWTDGKSYIAIHRSQLKGIRGKGHGAGPARLVTLLVHEYAHPESSTGEHHHDFAFLSRFHQAIFHPEFGSLVDKLFRLYVAGICKRRIIPSREHGAHLRRLFKFAEQLPTRSRKTKPIS